MLQKTNSLCLLSFEIFLLKISNINFKFMYNIKYMILNIGADSDWKMKNYKYVIHIVILFKVGAIASLEFSTYIWWVLTAIIWLVLTATILVLTATIRLITKDWKKNSRVLGVRLALAYSLTERADIVGAYCNQRDGVYYKYN